MQSHLPVRLLYWLHGQVAGTWAAALLVSCYGMVSFLAVAPARNRHARVLAVAKHANARREVARVTGWVGTDDCGLLQTGRKALTGLSGVRALAVPGALRDLRRSFRIVRSIDTRHGFLVSCRVAGAIAWYVRATTILGAHRPGAVLVSSDSHPEELGFASAARSLGIPQVFISHAYPTPLAPPLDFSLSILEGEAAVRARRRKGPIKGAVLLAGMEGDSAPLNPRRFETPSPVIGLFPPKALSWSTLAAIIEDCRRHFRARGIVIRWHPSMLEPSRLSHLLGDTSGIVESPRTASLPEVARQCDWVIADENSNVHLPVLKLGIPTVTVASLGLYPEIRSDQYGFVAGGIVLPPVSSIREVQPEALISFFSDGWSVRFQQYDAAYLRPQSATGNEVRRAIWQLFEDQPAKTRYA